VAAFKLRGRYALTMLCVFTASVKCQSFHGLPFVYTVFALPAREIRA
jgi:hypothetical protein